MTENKVKRFISIILPAYNEEKIIETSVSVIRQFLQSLEHKFRWEMLIVNDGSSDNTGELADKLAKNDPLIRVIHHPVNMNLGRALQTGFKNAHGEIIVVLDLDLSYSVDHIEKLADKQIETDADIVIASPYMKHGKVINVPFKRALLSRTVNKIMRFAAQEKYHTFTGMVRAYKTDFIKNLNLKTKDYEINPEILYKAMILRAKIIEIPANLDWSFQNSIGKSRSSGMKLLRGFYSGLMTSFIFRPYIFFLFVGLILLIISAYLIGWIFYFTFKAMPVIPYSPDMIDDRFSLAIKLIYQQRAHLFFIGGITLLAALQVLSLGFLSLQSKRYFEELFHINSSIYRQTSNNKTQ